MRLNHAVIGLLEEHLSREKKKPADVDHDLDDLCGAWSKSQTPIAKEIQPITVEEMNRAIRHQGGRR